jgi:hypothetical protein
MYLCGKAIHVSQHDVRLSNKFWARHLVDNRQTGNNVDTSGLPVIRPESEIVQFVSAVA